MNGIVSGQASVPAGAPAATSDAVGVAVDPDDIPDGLIVADQGGRITVFNRAAARLTGISPAEAIGQDIRQVLPLQDAEERCWWTQTQPYGGLSTRTRHPERSLFLPDGTELLVSVGYVRSPRCGPREDWHREPGAVRRIMITLRGAEQRTRLERSRADLVSTVAHELRSPLTSVKGFTATLLAKWPRFTDDQKLVMLETVNADADRVTRLITELLDVSTDRVRADRGAPRAGRHPGPGCARSSAAGSRPATPRTGSGSRWPLTCPRPGWTATRSTRSWPT